jgi:hypothetical protein
MKKELPNVEVRVDVNEAEDLILSDEERQQLSEELHDELQIMWGAQTATEEVSYNRLALETAILITTGLALNAVVKPFVESIAQEAAKDIWGATKHLVCKIWTRQSDRAYNLSSKARIVLEYQGEFVVIEFRSSLAAQHTSEERFAEVFDEQAQSLAIHWNDIKSEIEELSNKANPSVDQDTVYWVRLAPGLSKGYSLIRLRGWTYLQ